MNFKVDKTNNRVFVEREFAAPLKNVWAAWTQSELLDQWWAPLPWKTKTKTMDFRDGGHWLYAMMGPEGEKQWCRADYTKIIPLKQFSSRDSFCDEQGKATGFPNSVWTSVFSEVEDGTLVSVSIQYDSLENLGKVVEMGFREGFTSALENLDRLFENK